MKTIVFQFEVQGTCHEDICLRIEEEVLRYLGLEENLDSNFDFDFLEESSLIKPKLFYEIHIKKFNELGTYTAQTIVRFRDGT